MTLPFCKVGSLSHTYIKNITVTVCLSKCSTERKIAKYYGWAISLCCFYHQAKVFFLLLNKVCDLQCDKSVICSECMHLCPAYPRPANYRLGAGLPVCTMQGNLTCDLSHVTCHMSHVMCHMSHVKCHISPSICN